MARYLTLNEFVKYCGDLNVKTDSHELEHYEMAGVMLPVARLVYPHEYVIEKTLSSLGIVTELPDLAKWPVLQRLFEKSRIFPEQYAYLPDEELIEPFDRELGHNFYLTKPTPDAYKPWRDYVVMVPYPDGHQLSVSIVEHYYSHWQVHQIHCLQQYPDLYRNRILLDQFSSEVKQRIFHPRAPDPKTLREFNGLAHLFDTLSFWITVYDRETSRTFALVPQKHQVKHLDVSEHLAYKNRVTDEAKMIESRFGVTVEQLYRFLFDLIEQDIRYRADERYKLSDELRSDIVSLTRLIGALSGHGWDEIAHKLGESSFWIERHFRHIDIAIQERDEAHDLLIYYAQNYAAALSEVHIPNHVRAFTESEIDELLDYCERMGLSVLMTSLCGMVATDEDIEVKFRRVTLYTNLKNVLTALECLLRSFPIQGTGSALSGILTGVMKSEGWWKQFAQRQQQNLTRADNTKEFFDNLSTLLNDHDLLASEDTYWVRTFLIAVLARNFSVHNYPNADQYYGELFGEMTRSAIYAILYSWKLARSAGWV